MTYLVKSDKQRPKQQDFAYLDVMARDSSFDTLASAIKRVLQDQGYDIRMTGQAIEQMVTNRIDGVRKTRTPNPVNIETPSLSVRESYAAKASRLAYVLSLAEEVFDNRREAMAFIMAPHPKLRGSPISKLSTEWGVREVERILQEVIHGLPA